MLTQNIKAFMLAVWTQKYLYMV